MKAEHLDLIRPLTVGAELSDGWTLVEASVPAAGQFDYRFHHRDDQTAPLLVFVCRKELEQRGYRDTTYYAVGYRSEPGARLAPNALGLLDAVVDLVSSNERPPRALPSSPTAPPLARPPAASPTLFLVPGHLGDDGDLGRRSLQVLAQAPNILVEAGTASAARAILEAAGIDLETKRLVEIEVDAVTGRERLEALQEIFARKESACLFGVAEGAPAFVDPGSGIIAEASRLGVLVRSVGGPSALTQALMRIEEDVQEFLFVGRLECTEDVDRMAHRASRVPEVALILFTDGAGCRTLLPALLERVPWARGWLVADLTTERERADRIVPPLASACDELREEARVVVVLHQEPRELNKEQGTRDRG